MEVGRLLGMYDIFHKPETWCIFSAMWIAAGISSAYFTFVDKPRRASWNLLTCFWGLFTLLLAIMRPVELVDAMSAYSVYTILGGLCCGFVVTTFGSILVDGNSRTPGKLALPQLLLFAVCAFALVLYTADRLPDTPQPVLRNAK